jgi:hypothetical protein
LDLDELNNKGKKEKNQYSALSTTEAEAYRLKLSDKFVAEFLVRFSDFPF